MNLFQPGDGPEAAEPLTGAGVAGPGHVEKCSMVPRWPTGFFAEAKEFVARSCVDARRAIQISVDIHECNVE
jgi:hypothetical protein